MAITTVSRTYIWITSGERVQDLRISMLNTDTRLASIHERSKGKVQVVLHGTNEFTHEIMAKCVERGVTRVNVNKLVLSDYYAYAAQNTGKVPLTQLLETSVSLIQKQCEGWMDALGCSGKA